MIVLILNTDRFSNNKVNLTKLYSAERKGIVVKKYIIFAISFIVLFLVFQMVSGYFLTLFYTPDITEAWNQAGNLSSSVVMKGSFPFISLFFAFLAATLAYFTPKIFVKKQ